MSFYGVCLESLCARLRRRGPIFCSQVGLAWPEKCPSDGFAGLANPGGFRVKLEQMLGKHEAEQPASESTDFRPGRMARVSPDVGILGHRGRHKVWSGGC